jgi:hypothetical protein
MEASDLSNDVRNVATEAAKYTQAFNGALRHFTGQADTQNTAQLSNQFDSFMVWAGNIGVFASTTASADYRLRGHEELKSVLITLPRRLQRAIEQYATARQAQKSEASLSESEEHAQDFEGEDTALSSSSSLHVSSDSEDGQLDHSQGRLLMRLSGAGMAEDLVRDTVSRLYRLSAMVRLPLRHTDKAQVEQFTAKHPAVSLEGADAAAFARFKLTQLLPKDSDAVIQEFVVDRLATAVGYRRQRFLYRHRHAEKLKMRALAPEAVATSPLPQSH